MSICIYRNKHNEGQTMDRLWVDQNLTSSLTGGKHTDTWGTYLNSWLSTRGLTPEFYLFVLLVKRQVHPERVSKANRDPPPKGERGGEDGSSCQFSHQTKTGSQGRPGQPADSQQTQAVPQEQQVPLSETNSRSHIKSTIMWWPKRKNRQKTR